MQYSPVVTIRAIISSLNGLMLYTGACPALAETGLGQRKRMDSA